MTILTIFLAIMLNSAFAQEEVSIARSGKEIYQSSCADCHGDVASKAPLIFGQEPKYILRALSEFKSNTRPDVTAGVMNAVANTLSLDEMKNVASYLAGQDPCDVKVTIDTNRPDWRAEFFAGKAMAKEKNCMHCHGSFHHGAPRLFGQKKGFVKNALSAFKDGRRPSKLMNRIAGKLTEEEINKISVYMSSMILMRECGKHDEH